MSVGEPIKVITVALRLTVLRWRGIAQGKLISEDLQFLEI